MSLIVHNVSTPDDGLGDALRTGFSNQNSMNAELYASAVFKVTGYGLSKNDFTDDYVTKLEALNVNAGANVQSDWNEQDPTSDAYIKGKPVFTSIDILVSAIWTGTGFEFDVTADAFPISSILYPATPDVVILNDPDPTVDIDRIDLIVATKPIAPATIGTVGKITGTPASPELVVPPDYDPSIYYVIKQITVKGASAQPAGASNIVVFNEIGVAEWIPTLTANLVINTSDPSSGINCIEATNNIETDSALFETLLTMSTADVDLMTFDFKLKEAVIGSYFYIEFLLDGVLAFKYQFSSPSNLFNDSSLSYQNISITKANFNAPIVDFNQIRIRPFWSSTGYFLDNVNIFKGSGSETIPEVGIPEAPIDGMIYGRKDVAWEIVTIGVAELKEELKGYIDLGDVSGTLTIDFSSKIGFKFNMIADTTLVFTSGSLVAGKSIELIYTGNFILTHPTGFLAAQLTGFDGALTNYETIYCPDATTPIFKANIDPR